MPRLQYKSAAAAGHQRAAILNLVESLLDSQADDDDFGYSNSVWGLDLNGSLISGLPGLSQQAIIEDDKDVRESTVLLILWDTATTFFQLLSTSTFKTSAQKLSIGSRGAKTKFVVMHPLSTSQSSSRRVNHLDQELSNFSIAARRMGSSAAIIFSASRLRTRLANLLYLYRLNAADLYPRKIRRPAAVAGPDNTDEDSKRPPFRRTPRLYSKHGVLPTVDASSGVEEFPAQFRALGEEVARFLNCLNEFPEFIDEALNASISSFERQFRHAAVQRYIQDMTFEIGVHIDNITSTLSLFIAVGIPTVYSAQKYAAVNLLNLSTFTTFFSALTATALQMSFQLPNGTGSAVNSFWFASLVFSVASAVNGLLALRWKRAIYRSPEHRVPWWIVIWIKRSPFVFLVLSVVCFSIGLSIFAYASGQSRVTSTITTVLTSVSSFGILAVASWFALERWAYSLHRGKKWLGDIILEVKERFFHLPVVSFMIRILKRSQQWVSAHTLGSNVQPRHIRFINISSDIEKAGGDPNNGLPFIMPLVDASLTVASAINQAESSEKPSSPAPMEEPDVPFTEGPVNLNAPSVSGKQRWKRNVILWAKMNAAAVTWARIHALAPKLRCLQPIQDIAAHQRLVAYMQFSPDGQFLATSSWDRTAAIYRVENSNLTHYRTLALATGSPKGHLLLTKLNRNVKVWTQASSYLSRDDGAWQKTITRAAYIDSITWFPDGEAFLSVEGTTVAKLDLEGTELGTYNFLGMKLADVAVTPDGVRLLGVGPLSQSPDGLYPSRSKAENRLRVLNMDTGQVEHTIPVLNDVKDITLAKKTSSSVAALVSYENKAPAQLWELEVVKNIARLTLRQTYVPKSPVDFVGRSHFGGKNDELVLCGGKAGDIYIWDRESGVLLHHIEAQDLGGNMACIAWNSVEDDPYMFATGNNNGAIRLWTEPQQRPGPETHASQSSTGNTRERAKDREVNTN
ncbi:hypothetical protein D9757_003978 [Collybiopsis confluens]|uniref:WD40 repeat-like protein n=1 Tax=Collybiopsis confluens TaxID=2823264 RepID=A0A8H5MEI8_9AGAR|nr:hypothetical protein D9757_003978 [Collybiopsis confluens]